MQTGVNFTGLELSLELYNNEKKLYSVAGSVCRVVETIQGVKGIAGVQQLSEEMQETSRLIQLIGEKVQWEACNWVSTLDGWVSEQVRKRREGVNIFADFFNSLSLDGTVPVLIKCYTVIPIEDGMY